VKPPTPPKVPHGTRIKALLKVFADRWPVFADKERRKPLQIGLGAEIEAAFKGEVSRRLVRQAISYWVHASDYLASVARPGAMRHTLDGVPVEVELDGHDLAGVRARLAAVKAEVAAVSSAPTPPSRESVENYVAGLAHAGRPEHRPGRILWPLRDVGDDNSARLVDFDDGGANPLLLEAWLRPEALAERIYAARVEECENPYPVAGTAERLRTLKAELDVLYRLECALVAQDEDALHDPGCAPEPALGVRLA
jgi:hypothetical protein